MKTIPIQAQSKLIPLALWILILVWVARVTVFVRGRAGSQFSEVDVTAAVQILIVLIILAVSFLSGRVGLIWAKTTYTSIRMLFIYYFFSMISALWSALPEYSFYRAVEYMAMLMGVSIAFSYAPNFHKAERIVLVVSFLVIIMSLFAHVKVHGFSNWHTNSYSASAAILFIYCLGEFLYAEKGRKKRLMYYGVTAFLAMALGASTGSNIGAMCGIIIVSYFLKNTKLFAMAFLIAVILIPLIMFYGPESNDIGTILFGGKSTEEVLTLDHRMGLWERLFELFKENPLIGYGFAVLSTGRGGVFASRPHNSFFSILLGTGIVGLLVVLLYGARALRETFLPALKKYHGSIGVSAAIITGLVNSLSMPMVFDQYEESSLVFVSFSAFSILFVYLPWKQEKREKKGVER